MRVSGVGASCAAVLLTQRTVPALPAQENVLNPPSQFSYTQWTRVTNRQADALLTLVGLLSPLCIKMHICGQRRRQQRWQRKVAPCGMASHGVPGKLHDLPGLYKRTVLAGARVFV